MWRTIGQTRALALLKNSLQTGNLSHAYLFVGPAHVGKTTLALDLARALNCQTSDSPCGKCQSCLRIINGKHADVTIVGLKQDTSPKNQAETRTQIEISIDEIRGLQRRASLPPFEGKCKVFIIDGAESLSLEASNCLLKVLEEPPSGVVLLLLATEEAKLLPTVVSRCQRIELKPMPNIEVEKILESHGVNTDKARLLARLSEGCLGWVLTAADDDSLIQQRNLRLSELHPLLKAGWAERFDYVAQFGTDRKSAEDLIKVWLSWWRDIMLVKYDCKQIITNIDSLSIIEEWAQKLNIADINNFISYLQRSLYQIPQNANVRLVLEVLMLDMPKKEDVVPRAISMH